MTNTNQSNTKRKKSKLTIAVLSSALIIALLSVYAFLTSPGLFKPSEVTVTGTITASEITLEKITFTNTVCGTQNEANISSLGDNSGVYTVSLENGYSYNVSIAWKSSGTAINEMGMGKLVVDTFDTSIEKDWILQQ